MKQLVCILAIIFNLNAFAQGANSQMPTDPLKLIELQSAEFIKSTESCDEVLANHISVVTASEKYILSLVSKKSVELAPYEINMLQKILTNRFLHLVKAINMYKEVEGVATCSPKILGSAIAVYDLTELGSEALKDTKIRRIIFNFTNFPRYQLTKLKELYDHYTSEEVIQDLVEKINEEKITLPANLVINTETHNEGSLKNLGDISLTGATSILSGVTRVWGFISDHLKWRDGRINGNNEAYDLIKGSLKPLDLLYEKRNFVLSNYTIPGHWGHVAVWLGTKEELIEMGIWDEEFFEPFRKAIEEGKNIIEIRKKGINFVSLHDFINLDEIAVTRMSNASNNEAEIYQEISEQLDKTYDFTFNAQTSDKITCSEFIAYSYGDIHWPETQVLGQVGIKPDDLAILTLYKNSPAEFVLYLKGKKNHLFEQKSFDDWKKIFATSTEEELVYQ
ncbi:MAG: YiiX/YebB-like N1pC/P60 family cysteine hydrolase [Bacteriovorax sp.]|nr:YiiX/YebB-like N1pC/P60 family cysteine hydrolase [Bacteriovorax sp.]